VLEVCRQGKLRAPFGLSAPMQTQLADDPTRKLQVEVDGDMCAKIEAIEARVVEVAVERSGGGRRPMASMALSASCAARR